MKLWKAICDVIARPQFPDDFRCDRCGDLLTFEVAHNCRGIKREVVREIVREELAKARL